MGQGAYRHQRFSLILIIPSGDENAYDVGLQYFDHCFHKHVDPTEQFL